MLFELVEMICIRIIKGKLMKISKKIYGIFTTICALCPIIHVSSCHNAPKVFKSLTDSVFYIKNGPRMKQNIELKMIVAWTIEFLI